MLSGESKDIEYKEKITKTFLKTVSAFANYNDGKIVFGVNDQGDVIGVDSVDEYKIKIENMINDTLEPRPTYSLETREQSGVEILILNVHEGELKPYYYSGKAYKRHDTSTVEVDRSELNNLVLLGMNVDYEESRSNLTEASFSYLESYLQKEAAIDKISNDILKTLNLISKKGVINIAGELISDDNNLGNSKIDIVKFGSTKDKILDREILSSKSILAQYDEAINIFKRYYEYEEVDGFKRVKKELVPKEAFRESLANAIVHRNWAINSAIQISMFDDRVELISPGGLPIDVSKEDYFNKNYSNLRNPILAGVFFRLNIIEQFGTGIGRIKSQYDATSTKPIFEISETNLKIVLPILGINTDQLSADERIIYDLLVKHKELGRADIDELSGFAKSKTIRILNDLLKLTLIQKEGDGRNTRYVVNLSS